MNRLGQSVVKLHILFRCLVVATLSSRLNHFLNSLILLPFSSGPNSSIPCRRSASQILCKGLKKKQDQMPITRGRNAPVTLTLSFFMFD